MEYMAYNYFNEMHDIWLKYEANLKNAVPGRVGLEECSLYLFLFKLRDIPFGFLVGGRG